jgi:hypothetical protein
MGQTLFSDHRTGRAEGTGKHLEIDRKGPEFEGLGFIEHLLRKIQLLDYPETGRVSSPPRIWNPGLQFIRRMSGVELDPDFERQFRNRVM